jgi:hypothetical protein
LIFIPVLYVVIRSWAPGTLRRRADAAAPAAAAAVTVHE